MSRKLILTLVATLQFISCGTSKKDDDRSSGAGQSDQASADADENDPIGFKINDGAKVSDSLDVELKLTPPENASEYMADENAFFVDSDWSAIEPKVKFIFKSSGPRKVYLKYRLKSGAESEIFLQSIVVDIFGAGDNVLVLAGGSKTSISRTVSYKLTVPAIAFEMRMAPQKDLEKVEWESLKKSGSYEFSDQGYKYLYLQLRTKNQMESPLYSAEININPFESNSGSISLNSGQDATTNPVVQLAMKVPANAVQMKVFEGSGEFSAAWEGTRSSMSLNVNKGGDVMVSVKFRDSENNESIAWADSIFVDLIPAANIQANLSYSNQTTSIRASFTGVSAGAYATMLMISPWESFKGASWQGLSSAVNQTVNFCESGMKMWIRFRSADGFVSQPVSRTASTSCGSIAAPSCDLKADDRFVVLMKPHMAGCPGCHTSNNRIRIRTNEDAANRAAIKNFTGNSVDAFLNKMNGTTSHNGGAYAKLNGANVSPWFNIENTCN